MGGDGLEESISDFQALGLRKPSGKIEIIPAYDAVPDEAITDFCVLLLLLFGLGKFTGISDGGGTGETVGQFDLIELPCGRCGW